MPLYICHDVSNAVFLDPLPCIDHCISHCLSTTPYLSRSATIYLLQYILAEAAEMESIYHNVEAMILGGKENCISVL
jgi:hypothetical protein